MRGFTLLELVVVFSVIAIISTVGVVSFSNYNKSQELSQAVSDIVTLLNSAKSNSLSQIKPEACSPLYTLDGYRVTVSPGLLGEQSSVVLETICIDSNEIECTTTACKNPKTLTLSKNIRITSVSPDPTFFYPLFQETVDGGKICIDSYDTPSKSITVNELGIITTLNPADTDYSCP